MNTRWTTLIERSGDASIGAALVRLARAAAGTHRLQQQMLCRLTAAPGSHPPAPGSAAASGSATDIVITGTYSPAAPAHFEEVDR